MKEVATYEEHVLLKHNRKTGDIGEAKATSVTKKQTKEIFVKKKMETIYSRQVQKRLRRCIY